MLQKSNPAALLLAAVACKVAHANAAEYFQYLAPGLCTSNGNRVNFYYDEGAYTLLDCKSKCSELQGCVAFSRTPSAGSKAWCELYGTALDALVDGSQYTTHWLQNWEVWDGGLSGNAIDGAGGVDISENVVDADTPCFLKLPATTPTTSTTSSSTSSTTTTSTSTSSSTSTTLVAATTPADYTLLQSDDDGSDGNCRSGGKRLP